MKWNKEQQFAIDTTERDILVSASAGSGKTAVMIERTVRIMIEQKIPVDQIAVLAFNNDIVAELREKLADRLIAELNRGGDDAFLMQQIDNLPLCSILTFHGFCHVLVKRYFEIAGVGAEEGVMQEKEQKALLHKCLKETLDEYHAQEDAAFLRLQSYLGGKREEPLQEAVIELYHFAVAVLDRDRWLEKTACANSALFGTAGDRWRKSIRQRAQRLLAEGAEVLLMLSTLTEASAAAEKACAFVHAWMAYLKELENGNFDALIETPPKKPSLKKYGEDVCIRFDRYAEQSRALASETEAVLTENVSPHAVAEMTEKLAEVTRRLLQVYQRVKRSENKLDFNDLEYYAVRILQDADARAEIARQYRFISVDEYQDVNHLQEYIIRSITKNNNLFTVGDIKQSIYRFRLTEPRIMLERQKAYQKGEGAFLNFNRNYRSHPQILRFVNEVFSPNMREDFGSVDYKQEAYLSAGLDTWPETGAITAVHTFKNTQPTRKLILPKDGVYSVSQHHIEAEEAKSSIVCEAAFILKTIEDLLKEGRIFDAKTSIERPVKLSDIAILSEKRGTRAVAIVEHLQRAGLKIDDSGLSRRQDTFALRRLMDLLRVIANAEQDIPLASVMTDWFGRFTLQEMLQIRNEAPEEPFFYRALKQYAQKEDALSAKICTFLEELQHYKEAAVFLNPAELIRHILQKSGYERYLTETQPSFEMDTIRKFLDVVDANEAAPGLHAFLYTYQDLLDQFGKSESEPCDSVLTGTVHASKGLEYPIVFLIDAASPFNRADLTKPYLFDQEEGIVLKYFDPAARTYCETPAYAYVRQKKKRADTEERMRLLYVALTRAQNMLYITGERAESAAVKRAEDAACFMDWIFAAAESSPWLKEHIFEQNTEDIQEETLSKDEAAVPLNDDILADATARYLKFRYPHEESTRTSIKNTVTSINKEDFRVDYHHPASFVPETTTGGNAYHKVMENIDYGACDRLQVVSMIEEMRSEGILSDVEAVAVDAGVVHSCLNHPFIRAMTRRTHQREKSFMMYVPANEVFISETIQDRVLVQGAVDLLIMGDDLTPFAVIDFKKTNDAPERVRERYLRQIELYKLAVKKAYRTPVVKGYIYILGQDVVLEY